MTIAESTTQPTAQTLPVHTRAVIIGTGFAGLGMAIALACSGLAESAGLAFIIGAYLYFRG